MKEAIQKAIEGGYMSADGVSVADGLTEKNGFWQFFRGKENVGDKIMEEIVLDPLFWQALGKALGWPEHNHLKRWGEETNSWYAQMHNFIDHLANRGTPESFFTSLLTNQQ